MLESDDEGERSENILRSVGVAGDSDIGAVRGVAGGQDGLSAEIPGQGRGGPRSLHATLNFHLLPRPHRPARPAHHCQGRPHGDRCTVVT